MSNSSPPTTPLLAVFAYGTLRADFSATGDRWGVVDARCAWRRGVVRGFRLGQAEGLSYPFALHTAEEADALWGTLLTWPGGPRAGGGEAGAVRPD